VTYLPKCMQHFPHRVHWNAGIAPARRGSFRRQKRFAGQELRDYQAYPFFSQPVPFLAGFLGQRATEGMRE